jgi:membrane fusion protein (multidrug efflux system)
LDQTEVIDRQREVELPGASRQAFLRRWRWPLILVGPIVIVLVVGYVMLTGRRYEATDNAYVQIAKTPVSPSVAGRVIEIYV